MKDFQSVFKRFVSIINAINTLISGGRGGKRRYKKSR